ncbi:MAG: hypothetical protein J6K74_07010 [Marinifilaceae bacterium]|nr:hypothetical protein [Marinifilaceae bacterium]
MKKFNTNWVLIGLLAIFSLGVSACGDDNEKEEITPSQSQPAGSMGGEQTPPDQTQGGDNTPIFPELTTLTGKAGDTLSISFGANLDWQMTTNALWCQLGNGLYDIKGAKGEQEVKVIITDANLGFEVDSAEVTLKMGEQSQIIAKVFRNALNYEITVKAYGSEEEKIYDNSNPIVIDSYGTTVLEVEANFPYLTNSSADWLEITKEENLITLTVKEEYTQNPINNSDDKISFSTETSPITIINVSYVGMDPYAIKIQPSTKWNMEISADGQSFTETSMSDGEVITTPAPYNVKLTAVSNNYVLLSYKLDPSFGMAMFQPDFGDPAWFTVSDDKEGNISVTFEPNSGAERAAYLLALPVKKYEEIKGDLDGAICDQSSDYWDIKTEYEKYMIAKFTQEGVSTGAEANVKANYTLGAMATIPTVMLSEDNPMGEIYYFASSEFGVTNVAYIEAPQFDSPFQIIPGLEDWAGEAAVFIHKDSKDYRDEWGVEAWESDGNMALGGIRIPSSTAGTYVFVVFRINGANKLVVIIDMTSVIKEMKILDAMSGSDVIVNMIEENDEIYTEINNTYSVTSVFATNLKPETNILTIPTTSFDDVKVFIEGDDTNIASDWSMEGMEYNGEMGVLLSVPASAANSHAHVVFYSNSVAVEALHITVEGSERAETIEISPANVWGIKVSADGLTYKDQMYDFNYEIYDAPYTATITATNNDYVLVQYIYDETYGLTLMQTQYNQYPWYNVSDNGTGTITITFPENTGAERKGYLFAVPGAVYEESVKNKEDDFFVADMHAAIWELSTQAEQYVVGEFIQEGAASGAAKELTITNGLTYDAVEVVKLTEMDDAYWYITGEFGATSAYSTFTAAPASFIIAPGCEFDDIMVLIPGTADNLAGELGEMGMNMQGEMVYNLYLTEEYAGKELVVIFKSNYMAQTGLYIMVSE